MPCRVSIACVLVACGLAGHAAEIEGVSEEQEQALFGGMPEDAGRMEVFGFCGSCHSIDLVLQQGLTRAVWEEVLTEMVRDQEMAPLRDDDRLKVLDYLEKYYGPERRARRAGRVDTSGDRPRERWRPRTCRCMTPT